MNNQAEYFEVYKDKLYNLLVHCKANVLYYREKEDFIVPAYEDFSIAYFEKNIPLLEKRIVRENPRRFLVDGAEEHKLSIDSTSGTEGKPIICYRSNRERFQCSNSLWKMRRKFVKDLRPSDKFARFYAFRNKNSEIIANEVLYRDNDILLPLFDLSDEKLINYWEEVLKFKPRWLHGPSSTIYNLALVIKKYNLERFKFEFIELSGEYVNEEHQKVIEEVFECRTANQYGCREYWPIAYSNFLGKLGVITDNIYIEQLYNEEHDSNEIVITLLKNDTWPLVRYRLEDLGNYIFEDSNIYLTLERGRKADFFILEGNRRFNAIIFSGLARSICELYDNNVILQFQVIKESEKSLSVKFKLNADANKQEVMGRYRQELQKIVGADICIDVQEIKYIKPDKITGKTKEFIEIG